MFRWKIQNRDGKYVRLSKNEVGTILMHTNPACATIFGPHTRDYMDGLCRGLEIGLDDKFTPVSFVHTQKPVNEKVDDIHAGE
jgi:hypothetical protein